MRIALFRLLPVVFAVALGGCGNKKDVKLTGRISKGGQPLKLSDKGKITLQFWRLDDQGEAVTSFSANVQPDGNFEVSGNPGRPMPPGKYKITAEATDPYPAGKDVLGGKFKLNASPWVREVKGSDPIELDVDKPDAGGASPGGGQGTQGPQPGKPR